MEYLDDEIYYSNLMNNPNVCMSCGGFRRNPMTDDGWLQARIDIITADGIPLWAYEIGKIEDATGMVPEMYTKAEIMEILNMAADAALAAGKAQVGDKLIITLGDLVRSKTITQEDLD